MSLECLFLTYTKALNYIKCNVFTAYMIHVCSCGRQDTSTILFCPITMKVDSTVITFQGQKLKFRADKKCVQDLTGGSRHQSQDMNMGLSDSIHTLSKYLLSAYHMPGITRFKMYTFPDFSRHRLREVSSSKASTLLTAPHCPAVKQHLGSTFSKHFLDLGLQLLPDTFSNSTLPYHKPLLL